MKYTSTITICGDYESPEIAAKLFCRRLINFRVDYPDSMNITDETGMVHKIDIQADMQSYLEKTGQTRVQRRVVYGDSGKN